MDVAARVGRLGRYLGPGVLALVLGYLVLVPLYRLQRLALDDGAQAYRTAFTAPTFLTTLRMTVALAVGSLVIALVLGTLLAWCATRLPRRLSLLAAVPVFPIILPAAANIVGWAFLLSPRPGYLNAMLRRLPWWSDRFDGPIDVYTLPWIVILTGFGLTAFVYLFVSSGFRNINTELLEAAQVCGSNARQAFLRITLPILRPVIVYGAGVALLLGLGQFTAPLLLGRNAGINVLTTDMYRAVSQTPVDFSVAAALGSPLLLFGIAVVIFQKVVLGDQTRFVTHGGKSFRSSAKRSWFAPIAIVAFGLISAVLPLVALATVALSPFWSGRIQFETMNLDNFRAAFDRAGVVDAIQNSVLASLAAVAIAIPLGYLAATFLLRGRHLRWLRAAVDFIVAMPLGIPAVIFGAGFLLTYSQPPIFLYGSRWVVVLVYVTLMLPFTTRMQLSGMVSLGEGYVEASRVCGAGVVRTNLRILFPLLRPTAAAAGALMFVLLIHEFSASMLVRSARMQVMGTILFDYWSNGHYPMVATIAILMAAVTLAGLVVAFVIGGSDILNKL